MGERSTSNVFNVQLEYEVRGEESWWSCFKTSGRFVNARSSLPASKAGNASLRSLGFGDMTILGISGPWLKHLGEVDSSQKVSRPRLELRTFCDHMKC